MGFSSLKIYSQSSIWSCGSLRLGFQMSRLRQVIVRWLRRCLFIRGDHIFLSVTITIVCRVVGFKPWGVQKCWFLRDAIYECSLSQLNVQEKEIGIWGNLSKIRDGLLSGLTWAHILRRQGSISRTIFVQRHS